jgi:hypothetical protein
MKAIFILITTLIIGSTTPSNYKNQTNASLGSCDAELSVEKNRSVDSAGENGARFFLILKNKSFNKTTYVLSAKNLQKSCGNKNMKSSGVNVNLDVSFELDNPNLSQNEITLGSGESNKFIVNVTVPKGTSFKNWGCIEIEAKPDGCDFNNAKTILSVYVPDPSEE